MTRMIFVAVLATALTGCAALGGLADFNDALVPELKPIDARIHSDLTCGDIGKAVLAELAGNPAAAPISAASALNIVAACERRDESMTIKIDPQAARKVIGDAARRPLPVPGVP